MTLATQKQEAAAALLPFAARLQGGKIRTVEGSSVFSIPHGWAAAEVAGEAGIRTVRTPSELEDAVRDAAAHAIFVPRDTFGWTMLERILRRNGLVKTIFWEE